MSATNGQIEQLRRRVNELTSAIYSDNALAEYIERYPLVDAYGYDPEDDNWTETYDLNAAAADIWGEKAAARADDFDFRADGGDYTRSQAYEQAMKQARYYQARRSFKTVTMQASPKMPPDPESLDSDESN